jgi:LysM repeat protein
VQPGDSIWLIAHKFGVDMDALRALNHIVDNLIYPGQIIYLPNSNGSGGQPSAPGAPSTGADAGTGAQQPVPGQEEGQGQDIPTMPNTGITSRKP